MSEKWLEISDGKQCGWRCGRIWLDSPAVAVAWAGRSAGGGRRRRPAGGDGGGGGGQRAAVLARATRDGWNSTCTGGASGWSVSWRSRSIAVEPISWLGWRIDDKGTADAEAKAMSS